MTDRSRPPADVPKPWPAVPACHGWLGLDRRGRWLLRGEPIAHPGLRAAIGNHYCADAAGAWYFGNGPQRVYVDLECAPWILQFTPAGGLQTHTGRLDAEPRAAWVDETGTVLLETSIGAGVLDGADLLVFANSLAMADGRPATDTDVEALLGDLPAVRMPALDWCHAGRLIPVGRLVAADAPARLGFVRTPRAT